MKKARAAIDTGAVAGPVEAARSVNPVGGYSGDVHPEKPLDDSSQYTSSPASVIAFRYPNCLLARATTDAEQFDGEQRYTTSSTP